MLKASVHANTSGVFKGFHKNKETGIGQFGGSNSDALFRIKGNIVLPFPIFSNFNCKYIVYNILVFIGEIIFGLFLVLLCRCFDDC